MRQMLMSCASLRPTDGAVALRAVLRRLCSSSDTSRTSIYLVVNAEIALRKAPAADQSDRSDGERKWCSSSLKELILPAGRSYCVVSNRIATLARVLTLAGVNY
jgi:hypothetical protein